MFQALLSRLAMFALLIVVPAIGPAEAQPAAKNVILFIADGWGYNHVDAASYYAYGRAGQNVYERLFTRMPMSTFSEDGSYDEEKSWASFEHFCSGSTDSAAAATTLASGVKTANRHAGVDSAGKPLHTIIDHAENLGKSTGVISSVMFYHATSAAFIAHNEERGEYGAISSEILRDCAVDVVMGGGHPLYDDGGHLRTEPSGNGSVPIPKPDYGRFGGESNWKGLKSKELGADADRDGLADPWNLIQTREEFLSLTDGDTPKRVFGLAMVAGTLQAKRDGIDEDRKDDPPHAAPPIETVPTLAEMTRGALNVLDNNPQGFFAMIEGGAVDWANHDNEGGRMLEEMIDFESAVSVAIEWVKRNSSWDETLVIVTGDHECGYLTGPGSDPDWIPIVNNGKGVMPGMEYHTGTHTNQLIPCFVKGVGAALFERRAKGNDKQHGPYIDNTDVGQILCAVLK